MQELIKIQTNQDGKSVDARELHVFLNSKQEFASWIKNRINKYGFIQDTDFIKFDNFIKSDSKARIEYHISIDMAKELSMVERNERGRQARQYFIECEKELKQSRQMTLAEQLLQSVQITVNLEREQAKIQAEQKEQDLRLQVIEDRQSSAKNEMLQMPLLDVSAPEIPFRKQISQWVNNYCKATGTAHREAWNTLYAEYNFRYGTNLRLRQTNHQKAHGQKLPILEFVDVDGNLDGLYAIAQAKIQIPKF